MRKFLAFLLVAALFFCIVNLQISAQNIDISAQAAVLIEAQTGKVLFGKNENEKMPMASTTKIMTTLLCLESGNLDEKFVVDPNAIKVEGSSMGLVEGDIVTKRALCYGMLLPSGNDAANATAIKIAGSYEAFADMMNARAKQIGMLNTYFVTPSGLEGEGHGSTAYDMALLTREALNNADFRAICSQKNSKISFGNPPYDRWLKNSNKLLDYYSGCIGVKTGFTDDAGRCLVSAAERNGVTLICVTLKAPSDWSDHAKMFDYGFSVVKNYDLPVSSEPASVNLVGGFKDTVPVKLSAKPTAALVTEDFSKVTSKVILQKFIYAPVKIGENVGEVQYFIDGKLFETIPIVTSEDEEANIDMPNSTLFETIKHYLGALFN